MVATKFKCNEMATNCNPKDLILSHGTLMTHENQSAQASSFGMDEYYNLNSNPIEYFDTKFEDLRVNVGKIHSNELNIIC